MIKKDMTFTQSIAGMVKIMNPKSTVFDGIKLSTPKPIIKKQRVTRTKPNKQPERELEMQILRYLDIHGVKVGKVKIKGVALPNGNWGFDRWNFRGKADLEAFYKGRMYAIEVKAPTGLLSDEQKQYRALFHKPPDRIFITAYSLSDVDVIIGNQLTAL
jgi:hypothetical protein